MSDSRTVDNIANGRLLKYLNEENRCHECGSSDKYQPLTLTKDKEKLYCDRCGDGFGLYYCNSCDCLTADWDDQNTAGHGTCDSCKDSEAPIAA